MANKNPSRATRFQSGNPGRPKGTHDRRRNLRAVLLEPHAEELVGKLLDLARGGDVSALRICIDRLIPAAKAIDTPVTVDGFTDSPAECGRAVVQAIANGELSPDQGATIMSALSSHTRIIEVSELEERIAELEKAQARKG